MNISEEELFCSLCKNKRSLWNKMKHSIVEKNFYKCPECNSDDSYEFLYNEVCSGCGKIDCGGCPCGTAIQLVTQ